MELVLYIIIGFIAQMIDGTLGMAYGVSCRTLLKTLVKAPSSVVSAIVHYAEVPSSFASMISHIKYKNVDKELLKKLIVPGIVGSIIGAYIITYNSIWIEIVIDIYLIVIGIFIVAKGLNKKTNKKTNKSKHYIQFLGFFGAFFDASGGGGWGPIVTGSLMTCTDNPKQIIGTINASEFFITLSSSIAFFIFVTNIKKYLIIIIGLIIGGVLAAPIAAKLCLKVKEKILYIIVGLLLIILNCYNIITIFV